MEVGVGLGLLWTGLGLLRVVGLGPLRVLLGWVRDGDELLPEEPLREGELNEPLRERPPLFFLRASAMDCSRMPPRSLFPRFGGARFQELARLMANARLTKGRNLRILSSQPYQTTTRSAAPIANAYPNCAVNGVHLYPFITRFSSFRYAQHTSFAFLNEMLHIFEAGDSARSRVAETLRDPFHSIIEQLPIASLQSPR